MSDEKDYFTLVITPIPDDKNFKGFKLENFREFTEEERIQHLKHLGDLVLRICGYGDVI